MRNPSSQPPPSSRARWATSKCKATYTTDGKEGTNQGFGGNPTKSVLNWDGDTLRIETKGQFGDNEFTMSEKWALSADGKMLTLTRLFKSAMGEGSKSWFSTKRSPRRSLCAQILVRAWLAASLGGHAGAKSELPERPATN